MSEFMEIVEQQQPNLDKFVADIVAKLEADTDEETVLAWLARAMNDDPGRACTVAMLALHRLAQAQMCEEETGFAYASDITLDDDGLTIRSVGIPNGNEVAYSVTTARPSNLARYKFEPEFDDGSATFTLTIRGLLFADEDGTHVRNRIVREEDL